MLSDSQKYLLDKIMRKAEQKKEEYLEIEKLGIRYPIIVLSPTCLEITMDSIWAGNSYDREEARAIFYKAWGHDNGKPMVYYSGSSVFVYPDKFANEILPWLSLEIVRIGQEVSKEEDLPQTFNMSIEDLIKKISSLL